MENVKQATVGIRPKLVLWIQNGSTLTRICAVSTFDGWWMQHLETAALAAIATGMLAQLGTTKGSSDQSFAFQLPQGISSDIRCGIRAQRQAIQNIPC